MDNSTTENWIHRLGDSIFARWVSVVAAILAVLAFPFAFDPVQDAVFKKRTEVSLELLSEIPIFGINRPLEGLRVDFQGQDLTALQQGLVVSQIQIRNTGDVSVTPQKTTPLDPLGFAIEGGTLVRLSRVSANSAHLRSYAAPKRVGNQITLNQGLILEPGDYVRFDLLLTKPLRKEVEYAALGKVDGVKIIRFSKPYSESENRSLFTQIFNGGLSIQALRIIAYGLAAIGLIILLIFVFIQIIDLSDKRKSHRRLAFANLVVNELSAQFLNLNQFFADLYGSRGLSGLLSVEKRLHLLDKNKLDENYSREFSELDEERGVFFLERIEGMNIRELERLGYVSRKENSVSPEVFKALAQFKDALSRRAAFKKIKLDSLE